MHDDSSSARGAAIGASSWWALHEASECYARHSAKRARIAPHDR
jgi:hypothetical protein